MNTIYIKAHPLKESKSNIFRLSPDAADIVRQHQRTSELSASYIISELLRETKDCIKFDKAGGIHV